MSSRSPDLPRSLVAVPVAHRGLHDRGRGVIENSRAAAEAAIAAGYGIELDVQTSADGEAMVFHDYEMLRLTDAPGLIADYTAEALGRIWLPRRRRDRADAGRVPGARRRPGAALDRDQGPGRRPRPGRRPARAPRRPAPRRLPRRGRADVLQPAFGRGLRRGRPRPAARPDHLRLRRPRLVAPRLPDRRARRAPRRRAHRRRLRLPRPPRPLEPGGGAAEGRGPADPDLDRPRARPRRLQAREVADNITFEGYRPRIG